MYACWQLRLTHCLHVRPLAQLRGKGHKHKETLQDLPHGQKVNISMIGWLGVSKMLEDRGTTPNMNYFVRPPQTLTLTVPTTNQCSSFLRHLSGSDKHRWQSVQSWDHVGRVWNGDGLKAGK